MKKVTLITGANRGIGKEIAIKFASEDNNLILLARKKSQINEFVKKIRKKYKIEVKYFVGDLRDQKFINKIEKK